MTRRHIHYEAAFEDYLRTRRITYVAIDEAKRAAFAGATLKSFDFLVHPRLGANFIVDVKGRKVPPAGSPSGRRCDPRSDSAARRSSRPGGRCVTFRRPGL